MTDEMNRMVASPVDGGFIEFTAMIERLAHRFPEVPVSEIRSLAQHEYDAMTGGVPHWVPSVLEEGTLEQLERHGEDDGTAWIG